MAFYDLFLLALSGLWQQKLRTLLTWVGVLISTATLTISLGVSIGIRNVVYNSFQGNEQLREIDAYPGEKEATENTPQEIPDHIKQIQGEMSPEKRKRLENYAIAEWKKTNIRTREVALTEDKLQEIASIPHVEKVIPQIHFQIQGTFQGKSRFLSGVSILKDAPVLKDQLDVGQIFSDNNAKEIILHEYILYKFGIRNDDDIKKLLGETVTIRLGATQGNPIQLLHLFEADTTELTLQEIETLVKVRSFLPQLLDQLQLPTEEKKLLDKMLNRKKKNEPYAKQKSLKESFRLVGVLRNNESKKKIRWMRESDYINDLDFVLPQNTSEAMVQKIPQYRDSGYGKVRIIIDNQDNLLEVAVKIKQMGFQTFSLGEFVQSAKTNIRLVIFGLNFISLVALVVAAIGITNTMFTTVLERTKEIGIIKSLGASDGVIQKIFLIESSLVGLFGGILGVIVGMVASIPGNQYAMRILEKQSLQGWEIPKEVFQFPLWVILGVPLFTSLVTMFSAWIPSKRASLIHPVEALKFE